MTIDPADQNRPSAGVSSAGGEGVAVPSEDPRTTGLPILERLSSVHAVLGIQRQATEYDILITTLLEVLRYGPKTEEDLYISSRSVWPGAGLSVDRLVRAIAIAKKAGYIVNASIQGASGWTLSSAGLRDVEASRDWAREILEATASDLQGKVGQAGIDISLEGARVWTHHLELGLHASIRQAFAAYRGDVQQQSEWWLTPRTFDRRALVDSIEATTAASAHAQLLIGLALDAIDPLSTFGSDLVTHITVGYMLHAFLGRRDNIGIRAAIGSLNGDRAILDTPVLLQLLGSPDQRRPYEKAIQAALDANIQVVVLDQYLEELEDLITRTGRDCYPAIRESLALGTDPEVLATVTEEQVVSLWLHGVARGVYKTWDDFAIAARSLDGTLTSMGAIVRSHGNTDESAVDRVDSILAEEAPRRGSSQRRRDANTIVMVRRSRERAEIRRTFWPGAWVISTDRHMNDAYRRAYASDGYPIAITAGRLAGLISSCTSPTTMEHLAVSAATLLQEDSFLAIAAHYPVPVAIGLAEALGPSSGGSQLDLRLTQLTPQELLDVQPDDIEPEAIGARITAAVMTIRAERLNQTYEAAAARLRRQTETATMTARASEALRAAAETGKQEAEEDRDAVRDQLAKIHEVAAERRTLRDRRWIALILGSVISMSLVVSLLQPDPIWLLIAAFGLLLYARAAWRWTHSVAISWMDLLLPLVVELVGFGVSLR